MSTDIPGEHLSPDDFHQADFVKDAWDDSDSQPDPIESANLFEGDIDNVSGDRQTDRPTDWPQSAFLWVILPMFSETEWRTQREADRCIETVNIFKKDIDNVSDHWLIDWQVYYSFIVWKPVE